MGTLNLLMPMFQISVLIKAANCKHYYCSIIEMILLTTSSKSVQSYMSPTLGNVDNEIVIIAVT